VPQGLPWVGEGPLRVASINPSDGWQHGRMSPGDQADRIKVGDIYEDCAYHPVLCTLADYEGDELAGISLIDGSSPRSCSPTHCGPVRLTVEEAVAIKQDLDAHVARKVAEHQ
jgi:hypothetical protein